MALTAERVFFGEEVRAHGVGHLREVKIADDTTIFRGGVVAVDAAGLLVPASDTAGILVIGVADKTVVNPVGGTETALVNVGGVIDLQTSGGTPIVQADLFRDCFVFDDETVVKTAGTVNGIKAGRVLAVEGTIVKVEVTG